jgi:dihydroorotate dehydrogenase
MITRSRRASSPPTASRPAPRSLAALAALYRAFYRGVLCRLPEPRAVELGQAALRRLPLDRLPLFRIEDPRLAVSVGGVRLPNPLVLAAMYSDPRILARAMGLGFGAVTTKTITRQPRPGHPPPNIARTLSPAGPGLVNCNGFANPGLDAFRAAIRTLPHRVPLVVSVAGETAEDYVDLTRALAPLADLVELNISSPNTALVYAWSRHPPALRAMLEAAARAAPVPLVLKLSPDFADANEREIIPAALEGGVRVVNYGNTRRVEDARLSQGAGGLSGPDLFEATLANLRRTRARFGDALDIIATGGVDAPARARRLLDEGATAVGYFTGFVTRGPLLARLILEDLLRHRGG